ncbi:upf0392 protein rcom_0530710 [Phtheirospermum japonicum]|uniref:Glycosyltransferase family 92 protein n=1 Tax=Phtheirospermum japonicum TaxID=374723 RepID=A0A830BVT3_9LAMI|nr:upf0392 protein rcom_0530710 [Phtheirospermum japonicum]
MNPSSSDHRRKRKQQQQRIILRQSLFSLQRLSVRFLVLCFTILAFLHLLSHTTTFTSSSFRPILVVSSLPLLSSSSYSTSTTAKSVQNLSNFSLPLKLENRVLFPDHVLLLVSGSNIINNNNNNNNNSDISQLECVYFSKNQLSRVRNESSSFSVQKVLSLEKYDQFRSIVRCPVPISVNNNFSYDANLKWAGNKKNGLWLSNNKTSYSWENLVYEAALDGGTVAVFVKGLNLRSNRLSDPRQFSCHFGYEKYTFSAMAFTAAQEVVRCPLPRGIQSNPEKFQDIRVTVGSRQHFKARPQNLVLMPSLAKVFDQMPDRKMTGGKKFELCVCTMVWNQAPSIREWIMYHSWLGVERWFIYDNNSDDGLEKIIEELDLENYNVTRRVWPWIKTQEAGFSHCALRAKDECNWVSFMDVDEYFYFPKSGYAGRNSLRALVSSFSSISSNIGEIRTSCHSFGPSGLNLRPAQGVTVGYTCRLEEPERHKSIVRPDALDSSLVNVVHHFRLKKGFEYKGLPQSAVIINHYKYQVWEVFRAKFYRRVATYVADWRENQNRGSRDRAPGLGTEAIEPSDWPQRFCEVWDTGMRDFVLSNLVDFSNGLLPWEVKSRDAYY